MSLLDEQSIFGYCERCGIVYALDKLRDQRAEEGTEAFGGEPIEQEKREDTRDGGLPRENERKTKSAIFRWKCPDCDAELTADDETDLSFLKREHIRELHPNRPTV